LFIKTSILGQLSLHDLAKTLVVGEITDKRMFVTLLSRLDLAVVL